MTDRDLWDWHDHEHFKDEETSTYYVYSGNYIRKEKRVNIHNKDVVEAMGNIVYAGAGEALKQPRIKLSVDADGRPYALLQGWVEMTPEDHGRRDYLRHEKTKRDKKGQEKKHGKSVIERQRQRCASNCPFCRRG
ncbi:MAG: hypothetical protein R3251_01765 [Candidatus Spechtbacterales bacterium]|nr:hypothetical protein [Candidatus Spechtbacterales bacterium]